jgi:hypothetical protein
MERFPVELLYVLAFVGIVLFNLVMQRAARRRQKEEQAQTQEAEKQAAPPPDEPLEDIWGRSRAPVPAPPPVLAPRPEPLAVLAAPSAPRRAHPVRALLKEKRDLRRAVVLVMVLGPCRALEDLLKR